MVDSQMHTSLQFEPAHRQPSGADPVGVRVVDCDVLETVVVYYAADYVDFAGLWGKYSGDSSASYYSASPVR